LINNILIENSNLKIRGGVPFEERGKAPE